MIKKIKKRVFRKNFYEEAAWAQNSVVCGIDEVGRGCLAGPLVTAAVILPPYVHHRLLKDSKILTQKELLLAYRWITRKCNYSIGIANNREIDTYNIWNSTLLAMNRAILNLLATINQKPCAILVDAMPLNLSKTAYMAIPVHSFPKGESKSTSIAAASIVAKVSRDRIMGKFDMVFPGYQLRHHKGYGTKKHREAIEIHKYTIIHRRSFLNKKLVNGDYEYKEQLSLC